MGKKFWIWLWILALGLLMFFCVKTKLAKIAGEIEPQNVVKTVAPLPAPIVKKELKDIELKINKDTDKYSISGVLNSKNDLVNLASKYKLMKESSVKFDKSCSNPKILSTVMNLSTIAQKFKTGYLEYRDGVLTVDGIVESESDKKLIDSTLASISGVKLNSHVVVETPKPTIEHIGKLSITKEGNNIKISGIFSSETEIESLINLLKDKGLDVKKELCVVDSDLTEDRWKEPLVLVIDDYTQFSKGTIQFDKNTFSVIGETNVKGVKEDVLERLSKRSDALQITSDVSYIEPKPTKEQLQDELNAILKLKSIRFVTSTDKLIDDSKATLDEVADILLKNPDIKVSVEGHTDSSGNADKNLILSQKRADSVKEYLVGKGINPENLKTKGFGEEKPLVENNSKENKQINRRVEFIIIGE